MDTRLKDNEWILLSVLWEESPLGMMEIIERVQAQNPEIHWDYKTYHSFLRILLEKGYIQAEKQGKTNRYTPLLTRENAIAQEADSLAARRNYYGSVTGLMASMLHQGKLTAMEKEELLQLAAQLAAEQEQA